MVLPSLGMIYKPLEIDKKVLLVVVVATWVLVTSLFDQLPGES